MKGTIFAATGALAVVLLLGAADKPPAQYKTEGAFTGGTLTEGTVLSGVRFGIHSSYTRMVLDFEAFETLLANRREAGAHPIYRIEYREYPYRIVVHLIGTYFDEDARIGDKPALPFSVITQPDGLIKEMQVFLSGPCSFKVIEEDDPAKLSIDVKPRDVTVPQVYTVQLSGPSTAEEGFALVEQSEFPKDYQPAVLVLGDLVVVEQPFTDLTQAARVDAALRDMGYASMINERRGDELPQR